jgi:uncharacterized protein (TIGR02996 family)
VQSADVLFAGMIDSLTPEERQRIAPWLSRLNQSERETDPWARFEARFAPLKWGDHGLTYARLLRGLGVWLEERGDCRGEFLRLQDELARPQPGQRTDPPEAGLADAFLRDIAEHPGDEVPWLVLADWLEERDHPDARRIRLLSRRAALARRLDPSFVWSASVPWPEPFPTVSCRPAAVRVMQLANQEAQRRNHEYLDTGHILLALLREDFGPSSAALAACGVTAARVVALFEKLAPVGPDILCGKLAWAPSTRVAVSAAVREAQALGQDLTPEHLLLGLLGQPLPCTAARLLRELGACPRLVCERVAAALGHDPRRWAWNHPETW